MNPGFRRLSAYPFERLAELKKGLVPPAHLPHIPLSIGEPKHEPPSFVIDTLRANLADLGSYPATRGLPELRAAAAAWAKRRFGLPAVDGESQVLPVTGTREALFAFVQAVVDSRGNGETPLVLMPNPCYQIYEGAALLAGAEPYFLNTTRDNGYLPDLDAVPADAWRRCQAAVPLQSRQSRGLGDGPGLPAQGAGARRAARFHHRLGRVLCGTCSTMKPRHRPRC